MRNRILLALLVVNSAVSIAQKNIKEILPLRIGDKLPDMALRLHTLDSSWAANLSDFKGKAILLDYWGADCNPCIAFLPEMLKLQEQFGDKVKVILYTGDNLNTYKKLWVTFKKIFPPKVLYAAAHLPTVLDDTTLRKMFPSNALGLKVWLDSNHIYRASKFDHPTAESIQSFLEGKAIKSDKIVFADIRDPKLWFNKRIGFNEHLLQYSFITKHDDKFNNSGAFFDEQFERDSVTNRIIGLQMINVRALELYAMAYYQGPVKDSKFIFEVKDPKAYYSPQIADREHADKWQDDHLFCYAIKINPQQNDDIFTVMRTQLDNFFHLQSNLDKRKRKCWILKTIGDTSKIHSIGMTEEGTIDRSFKNDYDRKLGIKNMPILLLAQQIVQDYTQFDGPFAVPFIDESNIRGNIDIEIPWGKDHFSIPSLRMELQKYGLDLIQDFREVETIVLKAAPNLMANTSANGMTSK